MGCFQYSLFKKMTTLMVGVLLAGVFMLGCSAAGQPQREDGAENLEEGNAGQISKPPPLNIALFSHGFDQLEGKEDRVIEKIEKDLNVRLNLTGVPYEEYFVKLDLLMASDSLPDAVYVVNPRDYNVYTWIDHSLLRPIDEYLSTAPNLSRLFQNERYRYLRQKDKQYIIPSISVSANHVMIYRRDWLDNLGLKEPQTLEEFYQVMKAFTYDDPDRNGEQDTVGLSGSSWMGWLSQFFYAFGTPIEGFDRDAQGNIVYNPIREEYKEAVAFLRKLYSEGILEKDFFLNPSEEESFAAGSVGMITSNSGYHAVDMYQHALEKNPEMKIGFLSPPIGPRGDSGSIGMPGYFGGWYLTKDCRYPRKVVDFFDRFYAGNELTLLPLVGIEGIHYAFQGEEFIPDYSERERDLFGREGKGFHLLKGMPIQAPFRWIENDLKQIDQIYYTYANDEYNQMAKYSDQIALQFGKARLDETMLFNYDPEIVEIKRQLYGIEQKYLINLITGVVDMDTGRNDYIKEMKDAGLDRYIKRITEQMENTLK